MQQLHRALLWLSGIVCGTMGALMLTAHLFGEFAVQTPGAPWVADALGLPMILCVLWCGLRTAILAGARRR